MRAAVGGTPAATCAHGEREPGGAAAATCARREREPGGAAAATCVGGGRDGGAPCGVRVSRERVRETEEEA